MQLQHTQKSANQEEFLNMTTNPGSLKAKLNAIETLLKTLNDEMNVHKKEVTMLKNEKENLENALNTKSTGIKEAIMQELEVIENEMKRHFSHQKAENSRLQQQITSLKGEKTSLQQQLIGLQRRIVELEMHIGGEEIN